MAPPLPTTPQEIVLATMKFAAFMKTEQETSGLAQKALESIATTEHPLPTTAKSKAFKVKAVQTIFEDTEGRLWVGGGGGPVSLH